jgi:hypothetical protein
MYQIYVQFLIGANVFISTDPAYSFNTEAEAQAKADELQAVDPTGRKYQVQKV